MHAIVAFGFLGAAVLVLAADGVDAASLQRATPLLGMGGFAILIAGTSRMLLAGMARRAVPGGGRAGLAVLVLLAGGALGTWAALGRGFSPLLAAPWSVGMLLHVGLLAAAMGGDGPAPAQRRAPALAALQAAALLDAALAALAWPLALQGSLAVASAVHLTLAGFAATTVFATASELLPRFTGRHAPAWLLAVMAAGGAPGPLLVALGAGPVPALLPAGAALEAVAMVAFAAAALPPLARARRVRAPNALYAGACVAGLAGVGLGARFAWDPGSRVLVPLHGLLNAFGLVGLVVLAAALDLYAPALAAGRAAALRQGWAVVLLALGGLALAALGLGMQERAWLRAGLLAYAAALLLQLAGLALARRRAARLPMVEPP